MTPFVSLSLDVKVSESPKGGRYPVIGDIFGYALGIWH